MKPARRLGAATLPSRLSSSPVLLLWSIEASSLPRPSTNAATVTHTSAYLIITNGGPTNFTYTGAFGAHYYVDTWVEGG